MTRSVTPRRVLVTGAGGFIGHHLVAHLKGEGAWVRGVDLKAPEYGATAADEFEYRDLRQWQECLAATREVDDVYALAADMGGMGFISSHHAQILHNNLLISTHTLEAARQNSVGRYLYTSSACIYPEYRQNEADVQPLKEDEAYPAQPQDAYGWEKLLTERLCAHYAEDYGMNVRIVRFHNIFGPQGTWDGGREKAPAALCRKIAYAKLKGASDIEIWGDGEQTRSFCYIDDCVNGIRRLMESNYSKPLNLGQDRLVSINTLADLVAAVAGVSIEKRHVPGPQGARLGARDLARRRPGANLRVDRGTGGVVAAPAGARLCIEVTQRRESRGSTSSASGSVPSTWTRRSRSSTAGSPLERRSTSALQASTASWRASATSPYVGFTTPRVW
jgi:nucleoside-diphosphate-sugar epimerase